MASRSQFSLLFPSFSGGSQLFSAVRRRCGRKAGVGGETPTKAESVAPLQTGGMYTLAQVH